MSPEPRIPIRTSLLLRITFCLPRPEELLPVQLGPVELLLHPLKRRVANRAIAPERHHPPPLGLRGSTDGRCIGVPLSVAGAFIPFTIVGLAVLPSSTQLKLVALPDQRRPLGSRHRGDCRHS